MSDAVLFDESGSASVAVTVAVFVIWPDAVGVTMIVTVADAPLASVPMLQLTGPLPLHTGDAGETDPNVTPLGRLSVTLTLVAEAGPLFAINRRYVSVEPENPGLGDAVLVIETSALVGLTTRSETFVVCYNMPLVAVIVSGNVPTGVFELVVTDNVDDLAVVSVKFTDVGLNEAFAPVGRPLMLNETLPVNAFEGVTVTL